MESGHVLPVQYIFGGKTDKCHPTNPPPNGDMFTHSESHWQTEETFLQYITKILVPYKDGVIERLKLPANQ